MVDFAIHIEPDTAMINAMRIIAAHHPLDTASVNHTYHAPLRTKPISVNIETKLTGQHWNSAVVQLGVWMAAQFKKLEQMVTEANGELSSLPFLPAIVIQGHDWNFLAVTLDKDRRTVRAEGDELDRLANNMTECLE